MPHDSREARHDLPPALLAWGVPSESAEGLAYPSPLWLAAGASLLLWTALALLLTSA